MEDIIELWQQASIDESRVDREYQKEDLVPMIMNLEKQQQRVLRFKTLSILILLPAILILFLNRTAYSLSSILGIGIFTVSVIAVAILLNRWRFQITHEERSLSTLQLADISEEKIKKEKKLFTSYLPLFVVVALCGFNLMYLDYFSSEELATRLQYHLIMTTSLVLAFALGLSVRVRRFRKQFQPVMERIRKFKRESR
jgi:amino acid permease